MTDCEHPFMSCIEGEIKCHHCGAGLDQIEDTSELSFEQIAPVITEFIDGMYTIDEALHNSRLPVEEFEKLVAEMVPKTFLTKTILGTGRPQIVDVEPHRISKAKDVDDFFSNPSHANLDELWGFIREKFPDIASITYEDDGIKDECHLKVYFVDDTSQKVKLDKLGLMR